MSKLNQTEYQIFSNQREKVPHNVNIYLEMFIFSFHFHFQNMLYFLCNPFFTCPITSNIFLLSKMIICFFIVADKTSFHCFSSQAVQILPLLLPPAFHIIGVLFHACPTLLSIAFEVMLID